MVLQDEILVNKFGQDLIDDEVLLDKFQSFDLGDRNKFLNCSFWFYNQNPTMATLVLQYAKAD